MMKLSAAIAVVLSMSTGVVSMANDSGLRAYVVDPLVKVTRDAAAPASASQAVRIDAVINEYESGQVIVSASANVQKLTAKVAAFTGPDGPKPQAALNFAGYVPVKRGTTETPADRIAAKAPCDLPDPLLEDQSIGLESGKNQSIWLTIYVPKGTQPGEYKSSVEISADGATTSVPVVVKVHAFTLPDDRTLYITNWFAPGNIARAHGVDLYSDAFWNHLEMWARVMADHRQNTVITPIIDLIKGKDDGRGNLTFDFSQFDRWVELFKKAGVVGTIEGGHIGGRSNWEAKDFNAYYPAITMPDGSRRNNPSVTVTSEEYKLFLSQFLPALQKHLEQKGWLGHYVQHIADEPIPINADNYKKVAGYIRQFAPKIRIIDACMCSQLAGAIDIWVPQPQHFGSEMKFFQDRQKAGDEVWFYTCLSPKGQYMNRFIDYPLIDVRLLHWVNFKYNLPGYLHWGLNYWQADPFKDLEPNWGGDTFLPPGDSHIVYPGKFGPMSSIRFEAMRDGIEDYEMLKLLEKKNPKLAREICDSMVRSLTDYTLDPAQFRVARARLVSGLSEE